MSGGAGVATTTSLRVRVLGGLAVDGVPERALGSRKTRTVLKVLALARGAPVDVATLTDAVWPDRLPSRPDDQLAVLVSRLRHALGRERVRRISGGYALAADWIDLDELERLVDAAARAASSGRTAAAAGAARAARQLCRGPVLPDDDGTWVVPARTWAARLAARADRIAAEAALAMGDWSSAAYGAEELLGHDPFDEAALRLLMRALAASGRPASALAAYARARALLRDELGASPSPETEALHAELLAGPPPAASGSDPHLAAASPSPDAPVGRDAALADLDRRLAACAEGGARLVLVTGEAGIGKTTLVRAFARRCRARGTTLVAGVADPLGRDLPLQPVLDAIASPDLSPPSPSGELGPDGRHVWYEAVLAAMLTSRGDPTRPVVLVVEDVHRADPATLDFLRWTVGRVAPLLAVATARPPLRLAGADGLTLGPLSEDALGRLLGSHDRRQVAALHARSGGNPLFALELAAAPPGELPTTVQAAVTAACDRLAAPVADVVRAAAVLGATVDVDLLASVLGHPAMDVLARLEEALDAGILAEHGTGFVFRHDVVREALDAAASPARRAVLHREAACVLDARPHREPLAIAVHARLGGDDHRAALAFVDAARESTGRADVRAAEGQLREAVACGLPAARVELSRLLMSARRLDEAADEAAAAIAEGAGPPALEAAGWVAYYRREYDGARRYADAAAEQSAADDAEAAAVRASALALGARARHGSGELREAEVRLRDALTGPGPTRPVTQVWLAHVLLHSGRPDEALDLAERALVDPGRHAHPFSPLHGAFNRAVALGCLGRIGDALVATDRFDEATRRSGAVGTRFAAVPGNVRAWLLRGSGRLAEADDAAQEALELGGAPGGAAPSPAGFAEAYWVSALELLDGRLEQGDLDGAGRWLEALGALDTGESTMAWHQRHRRDVLAARLARRAGDPSRAATLAAAVVDDAERRGARRYRALARAELALAAGGEPAHLEEVVATLARAAALEGWRITLALAERFGVDGWRRRAEAGAAALVAQVPSEHRAAATALVEAAVAAPGRW